MFPVLKKVCLLVVFLAIVAPVSSQTSLADVENEVGKLLLKKDLRQAIENAEAASANDLPSLLWRLSLYRRSVHNEKIASTVRQIIASSDPEKKPLHNF